MDNSDYCVTCCLHPLAHFLPPSNNFLLPRILLPSNPTPPSLPPSSNLFRFTMLYSELPDMSALEKEFAQPHQQQLHQKRSPPNSGGDRGNSEHIGTSYTPPGNGRTGMGPPPGLGNWNGNNHLGNEPPRGPTMQEQHGSSGNSRERPHPQRQRPPLLHDSRESNQFSRGSLRISGSSSSEGLDPYQRNSAYQGQQVVSPCLPAHPNWPRQASRSMDNLTSDHRAAAPRYS